MTKAKSIGKKALSVFLTLLMCLTLIPYVAQTAPEAEAATAGTYSVKVRIKTTNSVDVGDDKNLTITLNHKGNNGAGSALTAKTASVSYTWAENDDADNTYTFTDCGYPTSVDVYCLFAWTAAVKRKWDFTMYVSVLDNDTGTYTQVLEQSFSKSGGSWGQTDVNYSSNTIGGTPYVSRIEWDNTAISMSVPKTGTATKKTAIATVYDQYGVKWYQAPYYAISTSSTATSTNTTISGVSRTTSMADQCTVSVTNAARTWVDNGGGNSRDVYISAYLGSVKAANTTKVTINQVLYNVKFYNEGTLIEDQQYYYNDCPSYSGSPEKADDEQYDYTFDGWTTASDGSGTVYTKDTLPLVTGDASYYAHYSATTKKYSVSFNNYDGTLLQSVEVEYGTTPQYTGATPVKPSSAQYDYVFAGWSPAIEDVTGTAVYVAQFDEIVRSYDVIFKNYDGSVLQNTKWEYGTTPSYAGTPVKEATAEYTYTFSGWTPAIVAVNGSAEYTAEFTSVKNVYNVYYKNYDGSALGEEEVAYGDAAQMASALTPVKPAADGKTYVFAGWSQELDYITRNTYAVAQYAVEGMENYWVTFTDEDGTVLYKTLVEEGGTAVYGGEEVSKEGYIFEGWDKDLTNISEDTTVTALYSKEGEQYVVTYVDWDNTFISSMIVKHGENAVAPADPSREGDENTVYTFNGWDNDGTNVTSNLTIKATYDVHLHEYNTFIENVIPADCVTDRTDKFSCSCGLTKDIEIENSKAADVHKGPYTITGVVVETCIKNGYSGDKVCDACGVIAEKGSIIYTPGHIDGEPQEIERVAANCMLDGYSVTATYCTVCGSETSRTRTVLKASGHSFGDWYVNKSASCTEEGENKRDCANCNYSETSPIEKTAHNYEAVETLPTCTADGYTTYTCSVCNDTYTDNVIPKKGHTEEEIPAVEATCTKTGLTAGTKCSVCGEILVAQTEVAKAAHTEEIIPAVEATCTKTGLTAGTKCSVCGEILVAQTEVAKAAHTEEEIPAVAPTCTEDGLTAGVKCSVCNEVLEAQVTDPKLGHDMGEFVVTIPATCTEEGEERADCSRCDYFKTQKIEKAAHTEETIPAIAPTCTKTGLTEGTKCSICGEILVAQTEVAKAAHTEEIIPAVEATCTKTGLTEGTKCSICGEILVAQTEVAKAAHTEETIPAIAPTCTKTGLTEGTKCSICGEILVAQTEVAKAAHTEEEIPAVAPTCTEDGLKAGIKCSVCNEILVAQETDPKLGHDMGEFVVTIPATCTEEGEERADCLRCDYYETQEIEKAAHTEETIPAVEATCTKTGLTEGTKCSICGEILVAQTEVAKAAHTEEEIPAVEATCTKTGLTAGTKCSVCGEILVAQTEVAKAAHTEEEIPAVAPTCTEDGLKAGIKCSVCNEVLVAQETDSKLGHDMGEFVVTIPATCTAEGEERADCLRCDYYETQEIEKADHTEETIPAIAPTCTKTGLTEGTKCSVCGEILVAQTEVAKAAHTEETIPAVAPTCTEDGLKAGIKCSVCNEILVAQETDPKLGHDMGGFAVTIPATCTAEGEERSDCSRCDYYETQEIEKAAHNWADADCYKPSTCTVCGETSGDAIGHDMGAFIVTTPATCTAEGEERSDCSRCDYYETQEIEKAAHTEETIPAIAPTCTKTGLTEGTKCSICGEILVAQTEVAKAAHTEEEIPAVAPTCTEDGLKAGIKCSVCNEVLVAQETDSKLGHDMGEFVVTIPATCTVEGEEKSDCSRCDYFETQKIAKAAHTEETIPAVEATCTATGLTEGTKCSICGEILVAQTEVAKKAHTEEIIPAVEATCTATGLTEGTKCSVCGEILVAQTEVAKAAHTEEIIPAVEATCTKTGLTEGTKCSVCGEILVAQTEVAKKAHTEETIPAVEATCTKTGLTEGTKCSVCGEILVAQTEVAKAAHTEEEIPAVEATCTKTGLTAGTKCSVCGEILAEQTETSSLGHDMGEFVEIKAPTCSEAGEERSDCSRCDYFETREIAKTAHAEEVISAVAPTCTESGLTEGKKCSVCDEIIEAQKMVDALGHKYGEWVVVTPPTCTEMGEEKATCTVCDATILRTIATTEHSYDEDGICTDCGHEGSTCRHICHRQHNFFARIVWSIILYICRIFGLAHTCSCGAAHY